MLGLLRHAIWSRTTHVCPIEYRGHVSEVRWKPGPLTDNYIDLYYTALDTLVAEGVDITYENVDEIRIDGMTPPEWERMHNDALGRFD